MVAYLGPTMALTLLGIVAGYIIYKALQRYRVGRLVPKLTVQQVTKKIAAGEDPVFIDLRPQGARRVPSEYSRLADFVSGGLDYGTE